MAVVDDEADRASRRDGQAGGEAFLGAERQEPPPRLGQIVREIVNIALPNIAGYLMTLINELTNTVVLGHAGNQAALAAVGLANMMQNCVGLSVGFGIANALDTLISQAHGAGQRELACQHLQRCRVLMTLQLLWMIPVLWFSEDWLSLIHQDKEVARDAGEYNRASVWGLFATFQFEAARKFLQNRGNATPPAVINAATAVLHVGWCCFFVLRLEMGNAGAGYANAVTWWSNFLLSSLYLAYAARREGLRLRSVLWVEGPGLREWGAYMKLAVPATVQLCSEWWFWEVCALAVGYLGKVALAAHVATLNWVALSFMPVIGINASTATLVGNALGANLPRKAKYTAFVCVGVNLAMWTVLAAGMVFGRAPLAAVYCSDEEIQHLMEKLLFIFAFAGFFDSTQNVMGGALRGIGRQGLAAVTYLIAFWGVMLPGGCVAAFTLRMGVFGIWGSFGVGTALAAAVFGAAICRADFAKLAAEAAAQMERDGRLADTRAKELPAPPSGSSSSSREVAAASA